MGVLETSLNPFTPPLAVSLKPKLFNIKILGVNSLIRNRLSRIRLLK
jgi:hypothetical protein